jgi:hypothetical protein
MDKHSSLLGQFISNEVLSKWAQMPTLYKKFSAVNYGRSKTGCCGRSMRVSMQCVHFHASLFTAAAECMFTTSDYGCKMFISLAQGAFNIQHLMAVINSVSK